VTAGQLLREARLRAGLSQDGLGERVGLPRQHIARWERDVVSPRFDTLRELIRACGFDFAPRLVAWDASADPELRETLRLPPQQRVARTLPAPVRPTRRRAG
jgi:transcriptional regulator with XRE-family HTH domain